MKTVSVNKLARLFGEFCAEHDLKDDSGLLSMLVDRLESKLGKGFRKAVYSSKEYQANHA